MATIIDALVVTLGLNASGFKKGTDQANKSLKDTEAQTKKSAEGITKSLQDVGRQVALLFIGFESASGLGKMISGLNRAGDQLGLLSKDIGVSTEDLTIFGNAVKESGGTADDAAQAFALMRKSVTDWEINRTVSPLLAIMQHLGVVMDKNNLPGTFLKLGEALRRLPRPEAFALGQQAGLPSGTINFLLQGAATIQKQIDRQRELNLWTRKNTESARALDEAWDQLKDQAESFGRGILNTFQPALLGVEKILLRLGNWKFVIGGGIALALTAPLLALIGIPAGAFLAIVAGLTAVGVAISVLGEHWQSIVKFFKDGWAVITSLFSGNRAEMKAAGNRFGLDFGDGFVKALKSMWEAFLHSGFTGSLIDLWHGAGDLVQQGMEKLGIRPRGLRNNNPGNLKATGSQARDLQGFAIFGNKADGIAAASAQLERYASRGINSISSIIAEYEGHDSKSNNIPAYIASVSKGTGINANKSLTAAERRAVLQSIFDYESGRYTTSASEVSGALGAYPGAARAVNSGARSSAPISRNITNTTHIDSITVHSQATDADGIAADIGRAIERKGLTYQADYGLA